MTTEYRIELNPANPGEYLACCGLLELTDLLAPGAEGGFEDGGRKFVVSTEAALGPWKLSLGPTAREVADRTLEPLVLLVEGGEFALDWWYDHAAREKTPFKPWGGRQTPRDIFETLLAALDRDCTPESAFEQGAYMTTRLGLDARSAWEALDFGYSPNDESSTAAKQALTYPWTEVLAAVGLQGFRPNVVGSGRRCRYCVWPQRLALPAARGAAAMPLPHVGGKVFEFEIAGRGQGYKKYTFATGV